MNFGPSSDIPQAGFSHDYYGILNVAKDATPEQLRAAYRFHLKAFHPDKFETGSSHALAAQKRTEQVIEAYRLLSSPQSRAAYDHFRMYTTPGGSLPLSKPSATPAKSHSLIDIFRPFVNKICRRTPISILARLGIGLLIVVGSGVWLNRALGTFSPSGRRFIGQAAAEAKAGLFASPHSLPLGTQKEPPRAASPPDPSLIITEISTAHEADSESQLTFVLRIDAQARSDAQLDPNRIKLQVLLYDVTGDKNIVLTDAEVSSQWITPLAWKDSRIESLSVSYHRDKTKVPSGRQIALVEFYGYIVRVYYDDQLQSARASPESLLDRFPPPLIATRELTGWDAMANGEYQKAIELFEKAASQGNIAAEEELAQLFEHGIRVPQDLQRALALYEQTATHGSVIGLYNLGRLYLEGNGVRRDYVKASQFLDQAAAKGSSNAAMRLGWLFATGRGVQQDYNVAAALYQKAIDLGNLHAGVLLGVLYERGEGVAKDYVRAAELYRAAAENGDSDAIVNLADLYLDGKGVVKSREKAIELLEQLENKDNPTALVELAWCYAEGRAVPLDYDRAIDLFHAAITSNEPEVWNSWAWFLATCRDHARRNGEEAVSYGIKACDATQWKDANFIGTLAAAYAEMGDFDRALQYGQQSLDLGLLEPREKQEVEYCVALFKRNKSYDAYQFEALTVAPQLRSLGSSLKKQFPFPMTNITAAELNDMAWRLSTSLDESERDGGQAVVYAKKACDIARWGDPQFILTLAAAYAELGQFETAVRYAKEALSMEKKISGSGPANFRQRMEMEADVELFVKKQPFRLQP